ncbi:MAG: hypothetical protein Fur005_43390 [Roseiflexaceae bacterium]
MLANLLTWISAKKPVDLRPFPDVIPELAQVREQIVTARLRVVSIFGSLALVVTLMLHIELPVTLLAGYGMIVGLSWLFSFNRQIDYRVRGSILVVATYLLALNELLHTGYSVTTTLYMAAFALLPLSFLSRQVSLGALLLAVATLALVGVLRSRTSWLVLDDTAIILAESEIVTACLIFLLIIGAIQSGNFALRRSLEIG